MKSIEWRQKPKKYKIRIARFFAEQISVSQYWCYWDIKMRKRKWEYKNENMKMRIWIKAEEKCKIQN